MVGGGREFVFGVDFSGAALAGCKIWLTRLDRSSEDRPAVADCRPAMRLPGGGPAREEALRALRNWISAHPAAPFGLDFPMGLPEVLVPERDWVGFASGFAQRYPTAQAFRADCRRAAGGRDLKRLTDIETRTPFSPYNLRLYRQTYHGIRDVLAPLIAAGQAVALPMQAARDGVAWLLETCPASLLKRAGLYRPYKGTGRAHRAARRRILAAVQDLEGVALPSRAIQETLVDEPEGDALDSLLAAVAVWRTIRIGGVDEPVGDLYRLEGRVYL
ncbi:MAG: hypothetical protein HRF50_08565 [Phycisphaerae bacterium]|jgi:hypothetical protein